MPWTRLHDRWTDRQMDRQIDSFVGYKKPQINEQIDRWTTKIIPLYPQTFFFFFLEGERGRI